MNWALLLLMRHFEQVHEVLARLVANPVDRCRQNVTLVASAVVTALAVAFVVTRTISRFWVIRNPGIDDFLLILSTVLLCAFLAGIGAAIGNHAGYPTAMLAPEDVKLLSKFALIVELAYYINICFIKVSIVLTYLRLAVSNIFRRLCYGTAAFHVMLCIASITAVCLQTRPLSAMWNTEGSFGSNYQIKMSVLFYGISIVTDFWILILPIKTMSKIRRPRAEKIALFCLFGAGFLSPVALERNIPRPAAAPVAMFPRRLSEGDYHKWL